METKSELRKLYLNMRKNLTADFLANASSVISDKLLSTDMYRKSQFIYIYVGVNNEVNTDIIISHALSSGKIVACPKVEGKYMKFYRIKNADELSVGSFNIPEPKGNELIEQPGLIIVPGVVFDKNCMRIGYGGGYYDKYLEKHPYPTIAVAYEMQMTDHITCEITDKKIDMIITEKNIYK